MTAAVTAEVYGDDFHPLDAPVASLSTRNIENWSAAALGEEIVRLRRHANQIEAESARLTRRVSTISSLKPIIASFPMRYHPS